MSKYILKQFKRNIVSSLLFCLLLAFSGALLGISAGLWYSAHRALLDIDDAITTIAVPDMFFIQRFAEERDIYEEDVLQSLRETVYASDLIQLDNRRVISAFSDEVTPDPLRVTGLGLDPVLASATGQAISAFVLTCERIEVNYWPGWNFDYETGTFTFNHIQRVYSAVFSVYETLRLHESYNPPGTISIEFRMDSDGTAPFEVSKQYVVLGQYFPDLLISGRLWIENPNYGDSIVELVRGYVYDNAELRQLVGFLMWGDVPEEQFPMKIIEHVHENRREPYDGGFGFFELLGSLEDALESDEWMRMHEVISNAEISSNSFQVLTTDDANSILRLNQRRQLFDEGRMISARESREGAHVALVSRQFAEHNGLRVGDTMPLNLYAPNINIDEFTFYTSGATGPVTQLLLIPEMFHPDLEVTETVEFTIVGIMNILVHDRSDYAVHRNMIIIPNNSIEGIFVNPPSGSDMPEHPLLTDSIIVPNGRIDETRALIDSINPGYGGLFRFFDQGYGTLRAALGNLRFGLSWILVLVVAIWIAVAFLFSMFYTRRKRKEAALLYAIGVSRNVRFRWVFTQCAIIIMFALGISLAVALPLFGYIIDVAADITETVTDMFRDLTLSDSAESGLRGRIPLDSSPAALLTTSGAGAVLLLVLAGIMSAQSAVFKSLGTMKEGD